MNISKAFFGVCAAIPLCAVAQTDIKSNTPEGFLMRGKLMQGDRNYIGAADQFRRLHTMPASSTMLEQADFLAARCLYEQGKARCVDEMMRFIAQYPISHLIPQAWATIGDFYFFNGKYGEAVRAYANVGVGSLDTDADLNVTYREGYALLRLAEWDAAAVRFARLESSPRFREAGTFFDAYILYAKGNYTDALTKFGSISSNAELANAAKYYICQIIFTKKDYEQTITRGRSLLDDMTPAEFAGEMHRVVGESQYHEGNDVEAARHIDAYLKSCEDAPERTAQYIMGVLDYRNHEYEACIDHLRGVTEAQDALSQSAYLLIGQSYRKIGSLNPAALAFEKAFNMPFDLNVQETAFFNYALTQNDGGRTPFNSSIDIFEQFLNRYPNSRYSADVEGYLITAYMNGNDYRKALTSISHIKSPSAKVLKAKQRVLYNLGVQALSNGKAGEAENHFSQAIAVGNYDKALRNECNLWMGECQYRRGNYSGAAKSQETFIKGVGASHANYHLAHYNLGYSRFQQRVYAGARTAFEKAAASTKLADDIRADAYNRIGDTYYYEKNYTAAAAAYDKAFKMNKASGDYALFQRAMMQGLNRNHSGKIELINEMLREYPNSAIAPTAMLQKADAYVAMNNGAAAVSTYDELVRRFPATADARKGLLQKAITERNMGNDKSAIEAYKSVITKYPTSEEATVAAEDLKLIYADAGNLQQYVEFISGVPDAPKVDVSEIDRLTFEAAEKAYMAEKPNITKMHGYVGKYPNGAYAPKAHYYIARHEYKSGNYDTALEEIGIVLSRNVDASFAEDALAMKGDILLRRKSLKEAQAVYEQLLPRASSHDNKLNANLGIMRTAIEMEQYAKVEKSANALLSLGGLSAEEEKEATFNRALARLSLKRGGEAVKDLKSLADNTRSIYGARAAFELAHYYYTADNLKRAETVLNNFIEAGTPHQYWLARGFILLADVCHKRGDTFEACEYLESLRKNYPGKDEEIFKMIDSRLGSWKSKKGTSKKK